MLIRFSLCYHSSAQKYFKQGLGVLPYDEGYNKKTFFPENWIENLMVSNDKPII
jgi:hypothetical protein